MQQFIPYHSPALFDRADCAAKNSRGVEAAILCVAAAEAFLHDLTEWLAVAINHKMECPRNNPKTDLLGNTKAEFCITELHDVTDIEKNLYKVLSNAERERKGICEKYVLATGCLCEKAWNGGSKPLQSFVSLVNIRNDIIHTKGNTLFRKGGSIVGYPKSIYPLFSSGTLKRPSEFTNWLNLIETNEFCDWCLLCVKQVIVGFYKLLPDSYMSNQFISGTQIA